MRKQLPLPSRIRHISPYVSARSLIKGDGWIFLDANESPGAVPIRMPRLAGLNRYPDPTSDRLRDAIGAQYDLPSEAVMVGNGSNELIDLLVRCFVRRGRAVAGLEPTYGMYAICARTSGLQYCQIPLDSRWNIPVNLSALCKGCDVLFLCNPNNPTGTLTDLRSIRSFCDNFQGLVVVDEAYGEFADVRGYSSAVQLVRQGVQNLVVLRTFSKAFAAAGIRLGYAVADARIIARLYALVLPYNVNALTQAAGLALWRKRSSMERAARRIVRERERMIRSIRLMGLNAYDSAANFFMVEFDTPRIAEEVATTLAQRDRLVVRRFAAPSLQTMIRVSVGLRRENDVLLRGLSLLV